jgi:hypothetical protein
LAVLFLLFVIYNVYTLRKVNVIFSENVWTGDYVIAVDHLPLTDRDKISWFNDNKKSQDHYNISISDFYEIIIIEAVGGGKNSNDRWVDDYYCFRDARSDNRCVDKSLPMSIIHGENDALTFDTHDFGGEYVQGTDGNVLKSNYENYFADLSQRSNECLERWLFR